MTSSRIWESYLPYLAAASRYVTVLNDGGHVARVEARDRFCRAARKETVRGQADWPFSQALQHQNSTSDARHGVSGRLRQTLLFLSLAPAASELASHLCYFDKFVTPPVTSRFTFESGKNMADQSSLDKLQRSVELSDGKLLKWSLCGK